ncbi:MAG: helix-turn-helix domain-containing protein [Firmicutes bacterium]|nr:helix-turn-helix domain-containing protein [Bacillota bacterium]
MKRTAEQIREDAREFPKATLRSREAADYLGVSLWFLQKLARENKIPCIRVSPRLILFRKESLDEWLQQQEQANVRREPEPTGKIRRLK